MAQCRHIVNTKILEETRSHQNNAVAIQTAAVGLVQVVASEQLFYYKHDTAQILVLSLEFFDFVHVGNRERCC